VRRRGAELHAHLRRAGLSIRLCYIDDARRRGAASACNRRCFGCAGLPPLSRSRPVSYRTSRNLSGWLAAGDVIDDDFLRAGGTAVCRCGLVEVFGVFQVMMETWPCRTRRLFSGEMVCLSSASRRLPMPTRQSDSKLRRNYPFSFLYSTRGERTRKSRS
jgi:hypothetical protein